MNEVLQLSTCSSESIHLRSLLSTVVLQCTPSNESSSVVVGRGRLLLDSTSDECQWSTLASSSSRLGLCQITTSSLCLCLLVERCSTSHYDSNHVVGVLPQGAARTSATAMRGSTMHCPHASRSTVCLQVDDEYVSPWIDGLHGSYPQTMRSDSVPDCYETSVR